MSKTTDFEVIIIGGSYAGLSAAMALGRSLRKTLIIDSGLPCNRQTPHSHNFITHDGAEPAAIASQAKEDVLKYKTIRFLNDKAVAGKKTDNGFAITTESGKEFTAKKLIFATGVKDLMPAIPGFADCWGITVIHCPYCHGYEFKQKKTAIYANGERAYHVATLVNNLTDDITIITARKADFTEEQQEKLASHNIKVIETDIKQIDHEKGNLKTIHLENGGKIHPESMYAAIPFEQHCAIPVTLACELDDLGYIKVNHFQQTNIHGVYACGDNTSRMRAVANAVAQGNLTGAMVNAELTNESF